jgi:hypothetical protein
MKRRNLLFFTGIMMLVMLACTSVASALSLSVKDTQIPSIGDISRIDIILDDAPNGLSGYNLTVSLSDPEVASIEETSYPDWAGIHGNSTLPADHVWMKVVDLNNRVTSDKSILLGTLTVRGKTSGTSTVTVAATAMDDDSGNTMAPLSNTGSVQVGGASSSGNFFLDLLGQIIAFFKRLFGMTSSTFSVLSE